MIWKRGGCVDVDPHAAMCSVHIQDGEILDRNGSHAITCPTTYAARVINAHNAVRDVIAAHVNAVEGVGTTEPSTKKVLLNQFDEGVLRVAFPKSFSRVVKAASAQILYLIQQMSTANKRDRALISVQIM